MATLREIRRRISGVKSIQKITKAMKMVAAARLRRAQESILAARPYARKIKELIVHLVSEVDTSLHPLLLPREVKKTLLVIVTSDRGLSGAFNTNIIKAADAHIGARFTPGQQNDRSIRILCIGKKGFEHFSKRPLDMYTKHVGIFQHLDFSHARGI